MSNTPDNPADLDIAGIEAEADEASRGPWQESELAIGKGYLLDASCREICAFIEYDKDGSVHLAFANGEANKNFIRHARTNIPALLARVRELESQLASLRAEIAGLREIVEKLPKTADGVPIVPGSLVYWRYPDSPHRIIKYTFDSYMLARAQGFDTIDNIRASRTCYSTSALAAAEAAKGEGTSNG